ncbi:conserved hypothetical protein [Histoplasma capsulatum G186AR]|uniref:Uncharacterized protein n=1 Tax=Ajellomyces capsulatus (strain G186AR / H82 / ATCC MYA-2454 / RMSCC 2432) TaxID=447093 RepID=C0NAY0_AJECG|nr:uncharacterized protein HCBG_00276 [Histoplasma capsulatum G186AR]EEH10821.1 conserved hypothetical protein [Histoplasma capsulatum G186AR]
MSLSSCYLRLRKDTPIFSFLRFQDTDFVAGQSAATTGKELNGSPNNESAAIIQKPCDISNAQTLLTQNWSATLGLGGALEFIPVTHEKPTGHWVEMEG